MQRDAPLDAGSQKGGSDLARPPADRDEDAGTDREAGAAATAANGDGGRSDVAGAQPSDAGSDAAVDEPPCVPFTMPADCSVPAGAVLPAELRCTGLYGEPALKRVACDVEPYAPAFELWSDGATKRRFIALPPGGKIDASDADNLKFPVGTQLWKEFRVQRGGASRLAETRLLRKSDRGWLYTTYVWSKDEKTAVQQNEGVDDLLGTGHTVPTRDQCRSCHSGRPDFVLGWDMLMLGEGASGLTRSELSRRGLLIGEDGKRLAADSPALSAVVPGTELERDTLGYLHANCGVSCHNTSTMDAAARDTGMLLRLELGRLASAQQTPAVQTSANRLPGPQAKLPPGGPYYDLLPGDPDHSLLLARMRVRGIEAQMPRLATNRVDDRGVDLVTRWIAGMRGDGYPTPEPVENGVVPGPETDGAAPLSDGGVSEAPPPADIDASVPPGCDATGAPNTDGLAYTVVVRDDRLSVATFAAQAPGSDDWYIVDMVGAIWRLHDGALDSEPFLDLRDTVQLGAGFDVTSVSYDERGLVGLAFSPDYESNGLFYVALTPSRSNGRGLEVDHDMVLELRRADDGTQPSIERRLLDVPSSLSLLGNIHNFNTVRFGPDGYLYVGSGDGGGVACNDAENGAAQDIGRVFGKILRLDPNAEAPYAAADNPFVDDGDPRVFHYGLRNPFRFSFDRATGDLYLGDVGQDTYEELDHAPAGSRGLNFGWPAFEANASCPGTTTGAGGPASPTPPIFVANRSAFATGSFSDYRAITGGIVYRGPALPRLQGVYLFGDYYGRRLGALYQCGGQSSEISVLAKDCDPNNPDEACLARPEGASSFSSLTAIVEDHAGEIHFVANGNSLLRLVPRQ